MNTNYKRINKTEMAEQVMNVSHVTEVFGEVHCTNCTVIFAYLVTANSLPICFATVRLHRFVLDIRH